MRYLLIFSLALLVGACQSKPAATADDAPMESADTLVAKSQTEPTFIFRPGHGFGDIVPGMTTAELKDMLGEAQVKEQEFYLGEGYYEPGLLLYPGTRQELEIHLFNDTINLIQITQDSTAWQTAGGMTVGSSLAEVVAANAGDFELMGFEWDYGGTVTDWNSGALAGKDLLMRFTVSYDDNGLSDEDIRAIMGDQIISSAHPTLAKCTVTVIEITQR